jgi:hypothetical protein
VELTVKARAFGLFLKVLGLVFALGQRIVASAACVATTTDNIAAAAIVARLQIAKPMRPISQQADKADKPTRLGVVHAYVDQKLLKSNKIKSFYQ